MTLKLALFIVGNQQILQILDTLNTALSKNVKKKYKYVGKVQRTDSEPKLETINVVTACGSVYAAAITHRKQCMY